jgi:tetratricopeptide (TPR) repeat protein
MLAEVARRDGLAPVVEPPRVDRPPPAIPGLSDLVEVGRGGMARVYSALQPELGRRVAVKVLSGGAGLDDSSRARVLREARVLARLRHPNVVTIFDSGEVDGSPYLIMELVEGGTLQDRLDQGVLPHREAAEVVRRLALAVDEAHSLGVVHRDLKPSNVLLARPSGPEGPAVPKLADFGLARDGTFDESLTLTGQVIGTPSYMAPEQAVQGPTAVQVGPAVDVHGLGAILHALLTGRPPYRGDSTWEILARVARGEPEPVREGRPDLPRDLESIVDKCLSREPSRRYRSAVELAEDLERYLEGRPVSARPVSSATRLAKWARRRPALATAALLSILLVVGGTVGISYHAVRLGLALENVTVEQGRTRKALENVTVEQGRTRQALDVANRARARSRKALESLSDDVVRSMIERNRAFDEKDLAFLRKVRGYYEEPDLDGEAESVESLRLRASGLVRVGELLRRVSQRPEWQSATAEAVALYRELLNRPPVAPEAVNEALSAVRALTNANDVTGHLDESLPILRAVLDGALKARGESIRRDPQFIFATLFLSSTLSNRGSHDEAERICDQACADAQALRLEKPDDWNGPMINVHSLNCRGANGRRRGRLDLAEQGYADSLAVAREGYARFPDSPRFLVSEAQSLQVMILIQCEAGRLDRALEFQRRRRELLQLCAARFPDADYLPGLMMASALKSHELLAKLGLTPERSAEIETELREAVAVASARVKQAPGNFEPYESLIDCTTKMAQVLLENHKPSEAADSFDQLVELADVCQTSDMLRGLAVICRRRGLEQSAAIRAQLGQFAGSARRYEQLREASEEKDRPRLSLELARARLASGDLDAARAAVGAAAASPEVADAARQILAEIEAKGLETTQRP